MALYARVRRESAISWCKRTKLVQFVAPFPVVRPTAFWFCISTQGLLLSSCYSTSWNCVMPPRSVDHPYIRIEGNSEYSRQGDIVSLFFDRINNLNVEGITSGDLALQLWACQSPLLWRPPHRLENCRTLAGCTTAELISGASEIGCAC